MIFQKDIELIFKFFKDEHTIFENTNAAAITNHLQFNYDDHVLVLHAHHSTWAFDDRLPKSRDAPLHGATDLKSLVSERFADMDERLSLRHTIVWINAKDEQTVSTAGPGSKPGSGSGPGKWATVGLVVEGTERPTQAGCLKIMGDDPDFTPGYAHLSIWTLYNPSKSANQNADDSADESKRWKVRHVVSGLPVPERGSIIHKKYKRIHSSKGDQKEGERQISSKGEKEDNFKNMKKAFDNFKANKDQEGIKNLKDIKVDKDDKKFINDIKFDHIGTGVPVFNAGPPDTRAVPANQKNHGFRGWDIVVDRSGA